MSTYLQLLHPVLTLGLLVLALLGFCCESEAELGGETEFAELKSACWGDDMVDNVVGEFE